MRKYVASNRQFWWGDFKAADFADIDPDATIAVLPLAAIEQHGPHLPLSTDAEIMRGMLAEVARQLPETLDLRVLPIQETGKSNEHINVPGTLSLDPVIALEDAGNGLVNPQVIRAWEIPRDTDASLFRLQRQGWQLGP